MRTPLEDRVLEHYAESCNPTCRATATYHQLAGAFSDEGRGTCFATAEAPRLQRVCPTPRMFPDADSSCGNPGDWCVDGVD